MRKRYQDEEESQPLDPNKAWVLGKAIVTAKREQSDLTAWTLNKALDEVKARRDGR